jgi:hypothetical protein
LICQHFVQQQKNASRMLTSFGYVLVWLHFKCLHLRHSQRRNLSLVQKDVYSKLSASRQITKIIQA